MLLGKMFVESMRFRYLTYPLLPECFELSCGVWFLQCSAFLIFLLPETVFLFCSLGCPGAISVDQVALNSEILLPLSPECREGHHLLLVFDAAAVAFSFADEKEHCI